MGTADAGGTGARRAGPSPPRSRWRSSSCSSSRPTATGRFGSGSKDLGLFYQTHWLIAHGRPPLNTVMGMHALADHMELVDYAVAPLLRVYDGAGDVAFRPGRGGGLRRLPARLAGGAAAGQLRGGPRVGLGVAPRARPPPGRDVRLQPHAAGRRRPTLDGLGPPGARSPARAAHRARDVPRQGGLLPVRGGPGRRPRPARRGPPRPLRGGDGPGPARAGDDGPVPALPARRLPSLGVRGAGGHAGGHRGGGGHAPGRGRRCSSTIRRSAGPSCCR